MACVCLGVSEVLGLVSRDLAVMRWAMKMLWAVTVWRGLFCAFTLRRRFRVAYLLRVWTTFVSGMIVWVVASWVGVKVDIFTMLVGCGSRSLFEFAERWLQESVLSFLLLLSVVGEALLVVAISM